MELTHKGFEEEMAAAKDLEKADQPKEAAAIYERLLKLFPGDDKILTRLLINYRKLKNYGKELKHINSLIKVQHAYYQPQRKQKKDVISLSEKLNRSLGAADKEGKKIFADDAIRKLGKRKRIVEEKIKSK